MKVNYLFVGDDWDNTDKWKKYEEELEKNGTKVIYFPYTKEISSTSLAKKINK